MTRLLATICLMTMFPIVVTSSPAPAQGDEATLKGINAVFVAVEDLPDIANLLGLTKETIQTDVELKLRLAGMRVVTQEEGVKLSGHPFVYVAVNITKSGEAVNITVELDQDVRLERNGQLEPAVTTWQVSKLGSNPHAQDIRDQVKDLVDTFLNDWLSVNPKK